MALLGAFAIGGVAWLGTHWVQERWAYYQQKKQSYLEKVARSQALIGRRSLFEQRLEKLWSPGLRSQLLLTSQASNLAQNELRKLVEELAQGDGIKLNRTRNLPREEQKELTQVTIQVQLQASNMKTLRNIFYQLESQKPLLFIKNISLRREHNPSQKTDGSISKNAISIISQFNLSGFILDTS